MTDRTIDHLALAAAIRTWPPADQAWWRSLLDVAPDEALLIAGLAHRLNARVINDDAPTSRNPSLTPRQRAGALRHAPAEARLLLSRMHHDPDQDEHAA